MKKDFLIIAVTRPDFFDEEPARIVQILQGNEADYVHIRKPMSKTEDLKKLLERIDPSLYSRIKIHDHFELIDSFPLGGIHLNGRNPSLHPGALEFSKSFHSIEEINDYPEIERLSYFFISPVFDSISKKDYKSPFNLPELSAFVKGKKAVALGGVTPDKFDELKSLGFIGGALLGHFFPTSMN